MTFNPKRTAQKLQTVINAWKTLRPTKSFANMTLDQFTSKVQPSLDARTQLSTLKNQATESRSLRIQSDTASQGLILLLVNAVKGDPDEGENGSLYSALGYVPKSARRSGLTRKVKTVPPAPDTTAAK